MTLDDLLSPNSEDAPCGADLNELLDPEYDEYYFGALGRLPSYYFRPGVERPDGSQSPDQIFNSADMDISAERKRINALLARSRDIRLLVLLAQWEALSGNLDSMAKAIEAIAGLLETFGDAVHPRMVDGPGGRRETLGDLANQVTMVQALQFVGLTGTDEVSLRKIKVAAGDLTPLQSEDGLTPDILSDALGNPANKKRIEANHAALLKAADSLGRISRMCQAHADKPFSPPLDPVVKTVSDMLDAITDVCPDLRGAGKQGGGAEAQVNGALQTAPTVTTVAPVDTGASGAKVTSHEQARATLEACEHYYRTSEPSSAALLLVTQARLLIGRPLIEALETLLPDKASQACVDFGPQTGFVMNIDRLRELTATAPEGVAPNSEQVLQVAPVPAIRTGAESAAAMRAVEDYFRAVERSSPVPLLLQRARSYLDKDFQSLVDELVPAAETKQ